MIGNTMTTSFNHRITLALAAPHAIIEDDTGQRVADLVGRVLIIPVYLPAWFYHLLAALVALAVRRADVVRAEAAEWVWTVGVSWVIMKYWVEAIYEQGELCLKS